jgi:hypothetical protein
MRLLSCILLHVVDQSIAGTKSNGQGKSFRISLTPGRPKRRVCAVWGVSVRG